MKTISFEEAKKILGENNPLQGDYSEYPIAFYEGNAKEKGDIHLDDEADKKVSGVLVMGDLDLGGSVINVEGDYGQFLCVMGSLKAKNIVAGGSEIFVRGDANIENAVYAFYNHGTLSIGGKTRAKVVMSSDHDSRFEGGIEGLKISLYSDNAFEEADFNSDRLGDILVNKVLDPEGYVQEGLLIKAVLSGEEFLKKGGKTNKEKLNEFLAEIVSKQPNATELDLSEKDLTSFPAELSALSSLKILRLSGNSIHEIPGTISKFSNLEELYLDDCSLTGLPPEIGKLQNLKVLDISGNKLERLPEEVSQLKSLRKLINWHCNVFLEVISKIENLEELELGGSSSSRLSEFPASIAKLKKLKKLVLSGHAFKEIPDEILTMENLEELNLNASLGYLKSVPDFSRLKNLKTLYFSGNMNNTGDPDPSHEILKQVFTVTGLEHLAIDRWGMKNKKVEGKEVITRPPLQTLPDAIGNFANLKVLDVSFNNITHLPESFYNLTGLKEVNFEHNSELPYEEFEKLITRLPNTKFNFANIPLRHDLKDENWQKVHELVKVGVEGMKTRNYNEAIESFDKAIALCLPEKKWSDYDNLYAHYGKMDSLSRLTVGKDKETYMSLRAGQEVEAEKCLELVAATNSFMYYSDESAFYREVKRRANNALAWCIMERVEKSDVAHLEKALAFADNGIAEIEGKNGDYIFDTKVRILLKAGKTEEAYNVVERALAQNPDFFDFQDIKNSKEYKAWVKKQKKTK